MFDMFVQDKHPLLLFQGTRAYDESQFCPLLRNVGFSLVIKNAEIGGNKVLHYST